MNGKRDGQKRPMSATDDEQGKGIRGDLLADDAASSSGPRDDAEQLGEGGIRGDGLADGAAPDPANDDEPGDAGERGIRGGGLATDA